MSSAPRLDDAVIRRVLSQSRSIAVVGASPDPARPSFGVMRFLQAKGHRVLPVNPRAAGRTILGERCHARLADIAEPIDMVDVFRRSDAVGAVVDEALALTPRPTTIWMQLGVIEPAAAARAEAAGLTVIMDRCPKIEYPRLFAEAG